MTGGDPRVASVRPAIELSRASAIDGTGSVAGVEGTTGSGPDIVVSDPTERSRAVGSTGVGDGWIIGGSK